MRSLPGRDCAIVDQGVCRFIEWSIIVTRNRWGGMGLAGYEVSL